MDSPRFTVAGDRCLPDSPEDAEKFQRLTEAIRADPQRCEGAWVSAEDSLCAGLSDEQVAAVIGYLDSSRLDKQAADNWRRAVHAIAGER